jgi:hypothetical protein
MPTAASRDVRKQHQQQQKLLPILDVFGNSAHEYNLQGDHPYSIYWPIPLSTSQQSTLVITARAETQEDAHTQTQTDRQTVHTHAHMSEHTELLTVNDFAWDMLDFRKRGELM